MAAMKSIFDAPGAAAQLTSSNPDWGPVFTAALGSGESYFAPKYDYVFRTISTVVTSKSVHLECHPDARLIPHPVLYGNQGSLLSIEATEKPGDGGRITAVLRNLRMDFQSLTDSREPIVNGKVTPFVYPKNSSGGPLPGLCGLSLSLLYKPVVEGGYFFGGKATPSDGNPLAFGAGDSGLNLHGCLDATIRDVGIEGWYDLGIYDNGTMWRDPLTNALSTSQNSNEVRVAHTNHGKRTRDAVYIATPDDGPVSVGGTTVFGSYQITVLDGDSYKITVTNPATTTVSGAGGNIEVYSDKIQKECYLSGEGLVIDNATILYCGGAASFKRGAIGARVINSRAAWLHNGFRSSVVEGPTGASHLSFVNTVVKWTTGIPFEVHGPNATVEGCRAINFGKYLGYRSTSSRPGKDDSGYGHSGRSINQPAPLAGLIALSAPNLRVTDFRVINEDQWAISAEANTQREQCGVFLGDYVEGGVASYNYGTTDARVVGLRTSGVQRPFQESAGRQVRNRVIDLSADGNTLAPSASGAGSVIGESVLSTAGGILCDRTLLPLTVNGANVGSSSLPFGSAFFTNLNAVNRLIISGSLPGASAANNSLFVDSTTGKLSWKPFGAAPIPLH